MGQNVSLDDRTALASRRLCEHLLWIIVNTGSKRYSQKSALFLLSGENATEIIWNYVEI